MCLGIALSPGATGGAVKFGGLIGKLRLGERPVHNKI